MDAIRCGRLTALRKPDGGVRGIVVGDVFRRVVARTTAKQIVDKVEEATSPHQYALKTKAGCETVVHILQVLTVVSVDGIGAFDLISRSDVARCEAHGGRRTDPAVCQSAPWSAVNVRVGGRRW